MSQNEHAVIEGEFIKPWCHRRLGPNDELLEVIEHADTLEELVALMKGHKPRPDWRTAIFHNGKRFQRPKG
jgi:hypothetical protein